MVYFKGYDILQDFTLILRIFLWMPLMISKFMNPKLKLLLVSCVSVAKKNKREILVLLSVIFILVLRIVVLSSGGENSMDVYYHVALADMGRGVYMDKEFPYTALSLWNQQFSDKELGFHLMLSIFRTTKLWLGMSAIPPFNFEYTLFLLLFFFSFITTAVYFKIKNIFIYTFLLVSISPFFLMRIEMLRPHLLAITILVGSCMMFDKIRVLRDLWIAFLLGAFMAWCYSNPHFILFTAVAFACFKGKKNIKLIILIPLVVTLGIVAGFIIHPQFPNTFINWKVQCVDVVLASLSNNTVVRIGEELKPADIHFIIEQWALYLLAVVNIVLFSTACFKVGIKKIPGYVSSFFILAIFSSIGTFAAIRFSEYAVPFSLLALGAIISWSGEHNLFHWQFSKKVAFKVSVVLAFCFMVYSGINYFEKMKCKVVYPYTEFASYLTNNSFPPATLIGNINWSDFPLLLFAAPQYRYLTGVDPMFAYFANRDKMNKIELLRTGRQFLRPEELYEITGTRFMFVSKYNNQLSAELFKHGFVSIYQGKDGNLFDLWLSYKRRLSLNKGGH